MVHVDYLQGEGTSEHSQKDSNFIMSSILSLSMVAKRKSGIHDRSMVRRDESASYVVPEDATVDVLSMFHMYFELVLERCTLRHVIIVFIIKTKL